MRLAEFIEGEMEAILREWEAFASVQLPAAIGMNSEALRDHAEEILRAVAKDIITYQSLEEQSLKSKGRALRTPGAPETAAETHAFLRAQSGFNINQMAAEYRALRASVLHLWGEAGYDGGTDYRDMVRFNEAIDQALAESVAFFNSKLTEERNLLLGMMGHDMRNPLHVIQVSASYLAQLDAGDRISKTAARIVKSGSQLKALLDDLIDFNRTNLGLGIHIAPTGVNLANLFTDALEQLRVSHPDRQIELQATGNVSGTWDPHRLQQVLNNLVLNALKHGAGDAPVRVMIIGTPGEVEFSVHNRGRMIERSTLHHIFDPLVRGEEARNKAESDGSLGLGLYIAREIAIAHGGDIAVRSDETETVFTVRLPRLTAKPHSLPQ
ncbi:MAG: sensor histidine kinase [Pseudomonadota bacterium]|nr:sensor histidine kinase [Pseudomonadota bacterium]